MQDDLKRKGNKKKKGGGAHFFSMKVDLRIK